MDSGETTPSAGLVRRLASITTAFAWGLLLFDVSCGAADTPPSTALQRAARAANMEAPKMIDEETRFEQATTEEGVLVYHYTLVNHTGNASAHSLEESLTNDLLARVCEDPGSRRLLELDLGLRYAYRSPDGEPLASVLVSRGRCGL